MSYRQFLVVSERFAGEWVANSLGKHSRISIFPSEFEEFTAAVPLGASIVDIISDEAFPQQPPGIEARGLKLFTDEFWSGPLEGLWNDLAAIGNISVFLFSRENLLASWVQLYGTTINIPGFKKWAEMTLLRRRFLSSLFAECRLITTNLYGSGILPEHFLNRLQTDLGFETLEDLSCEDVPKPFKPGSMIDNFQDVYSDLIGGPLEFCLNDE